MAFKIIKLDVEKDNQETRFRVVLEVEDIDVIITRKNFRSVFESLSFSSHRIGSVLKLINKKYPIDLKKYKVSFEERYSDMELAEYLSFYGLKVRKRNKRLNMSEAIKMLEGRGYEVSGSFEGIPYSSAVFNKN